MFSNAEISAIWNEYSEDERDDMTLAEFRKQVKDTLNPQKNTQILNQMVEMRMQYATALRTKRQINKALEQDSVRID